MTNILALGGTIVQPFVDILLYLLALTGVIGHFLVCLALWAAGTAGIAMEFVLLTVFLFEFSKKCDSYMGMGFWIGGMVGAVCSYLLLTNRSMGESIESMLGLALVFAAVVFVPYLIYNVYLRFFVPGEQTCP